MRYLLIAVTALPLLAFAWSQAPTRPDSPRDVVTGPVVVELFTSQGCSSCPPADRVLHELATDKEVIALSFHVDYWNYLGWKDPFSSPYYSARQSDYTDVLGSRTYTPQLVINGRDELVGSRRDEVLSKVAAAKEMQTSYRPEIEVSEDSPGKLQIRYELGKTPVGARVSAVLVQDNATSSVRRGENRGRELTHVNVVRDLVHAPAAAGGTLRLELPEGVLRDDVHVVLLVQEANSGAIIGAARTALSAR